MKFTHTGRIRSLEGKPDQAVNLRKHKSHWVTPDGIQFRERTGAQIGARPSLVLDLNSIGAIAAHAVSAEADCAACA